MKKTLLVLFLVALVYPGLSQSVPSSAKEKKHTTKSARFKKTPEKDVKAQKMPEIWEAGAMIIKNSKQADSMLVSMFNGKTTSWYPYSKEIPSYYGQSTLIHELELWFFYGNNYTPQEKNVASYDEEGRIIRLETHLHENNNWKPYFATETAYDHWGEETFYAFYMYDDHAGEWEIVYGFRANDTFNDNGVLVQRVWEYHMSGDWYPDYMEEYILNEQDVIVEIIEYYYDGWDKDWQPEFRMVLELCENNMWQSGYAYEWHWFYEEWVPQIKYLDFQWFDFDRMLFSYLLTMVNPDAFDDDWDDWKNHDDIDWTNYLRFHMDYTEGGLMTLMHLELWYDSDGEYDFDWHPVMKIEIAYDHHLNVVFETFSTHNGFEWEIMFGFKLDMEYHNDGSVKSFVYSETWDDWDWKGKFIPVLRYDYHYGEDTTDIPLVEQPGSVLKVFPNPAINYLRLELPATFGYADIDIIGTDGRVLFQTQKANFSDGQPVILDVSGLKNGVYIVRVQHAAQQYATRFIKR